METIAKIRRLYYRDHKGFKTIARELGLSKNTVKKVIKEDRQTTDYVRKICHRPALGAYQAVLEQLLRDNVNEPARRRYTAKKLYDELVKLGYVGSYEAVSHYVKDWKLASGQSRLTGFVPQSFEAGEAFQFDFSEEEIELAGVVTRIKVAQIRLCYSRLFLLVAYPNEQLEMVLDAHDKAFTFLGGVCRRGIYDNMKTVVTRVLRGKERVFNPRFLALASHYCFEVVPCTPAAGWEKGQVENQVGLGRKNFFTPLRRVATLDELNLQLQADCLNWAKTKRHPEIKDKTIWQVYETERALLLQCRAPFNAYKVQLTRVNSLCLIHFETNAYSVDCHYVGQAVELRIYAGRIEVVCSATSTKVAEHVRCFGRNQRIYNVWHYVPLLARKPGALRNGAPFKAAPWPAVLKTVQQKLAVYADGDEQFIRILLQVKKAGLGPVENACQAALAQGSCSADMVLQCLNAPLCFGAAQQPNTKTTTQSTVLLTIVPHGDSSAYQSLISLQTNALASQVILEASYAA